MKRSFLVGALALAAPLFVANLASAQLNVLQPGDAIIAIDTDGFVSNSGYPGGENPPNAIDGTSDKYLNFGGFGSGIIVTPGSFTGDTIANGFQFTTANDAEGRDPATYEIWGTTDAIISADNSTGLAETWTLLDSGAAALPAGRDTPAGVVSFTNTDPYSSYKFVFPTLKAVTAMQIAEIELFGDSPADALTGVSLFAPSDAVLAIHLGPDSSYPVPNEAPDKLLDGDAGSKYLNFGAENSGFIVTPAAGASVVTNFEISTANDHDERDPASYVLYGTNDAVDSTDNSAPDGTESWTVISSGSLSLPTAREVKGGVVSFANAASYTSYRVDFPTLRDGGAANSMQISNFQFNVPEPSSVALGLLALSAAAVVGRSRR